MFLVPFVWMLLTATASGHAACVDDGCQGVQTNSLLQSGSATKKFTAAALEDSQTDAIEQGHGFEDSQLEPEGMQTEGVETIPPFTKYANGLCQTRAAAYYGQYPMGSYQDFPGIGSDLTGVACAKKCGTCKAFDVDTRDGQNNRCRVYFSNRAGYAWAHYAPKQKCFNIDPPTPSPTDAPTESPTEAPTEPPTEAPTESPTEAPKKRGGRGRKEKKQKGEGEGRKNKRKNKSSKCNGGEAERPWCKKWCYSKKHEGKPWNETDAESLGFKSSEVKCKWAGCGGCPECCSDSCSTEQNETEWQVKCSTGHMCGGCRDCDFIE